MKTTSTVLDHLLDSDLDYRTGTRGGFYNHLAMALVAVHRLGGSDEQLRELASGSDSYALPRERPPELADLRDDIDRRGPGPVLPERLAQALDVPGAAWFHSMIRLAYALDVGHSGQIAGAVIDWSAHDDVLPGRPAGAGERMARDLFRDLRALAESGDEPRNGLAGVASRPGFEDLVSSTAVGAGILDDLAEASLAAYVAGDGFGTLHMVTGVQAARGIDALLDDAGRARFRARMVQAIAAAYVASGSPELPDDSVLDGLRGASHASWSSISGVAAASHDMHVSKLTYAATLEFARTGDPLYHYVAARVTGL